MKRFLAMVLCVLLPAAGVHALLGADDSMPAAARALLDSLAPELRAQATLPFEDSNRLDWHYVPRERKGVALGTLSDAQRELVRALLRTALSEQGRDKLEGVFALEAILRAHEAWRDPGAYFVTIFGVPGSDEPWGWRMEGHHLSLNFSSVESELAVTPAFFGANPARVDSGPRAGLRVLGRADDLAHDLLASLSDEQRALAVLSGDPPADILFGPGKSAAVLEHAGLEGERMDEAQSARVKQLVDEYLRDFQPKIAERELARILADGIRSLRFAWIGSPRAGEPSYWRLQGPRFVIEFENAQAGANHVHTVWRDLENDFGADLLRRHHEESQH